MSEGSSQLRKLTKLDINKFTTHHYVDIHNNDGIQRLCLRYGLINDTSDYRQVGCGRNEYE